MSSFNLNGKVGLIVGIANDHSIAWGCARAFRDAGAELAVTYLNQKAEPYVRPLAEQVQAPIILPMDVAQPGQLEAVFDAVKQKWGRLDFLLHSIAFAPRDDLHGRVVDSSRDGFLAAIDISCHSFARMAKLAEPLMDKGGSLLTVTFEGSRRVVPHYNLMGPVKAALEAVVRSLAVELAPQGIRVHALSPGVIQTRAASGLPEFNSLIQEALAKTPTHTLPTIEQVGNVATFLVSDASSGLSGETVHIDNGYHLL